MEVRQQQDWQRFAARFHEIETNVERVVRGKHSEIRLALVALVAEGHLLIEDVPGVGKTMLAKAIARSIDCSFRRIQFTPDLLPTDVTGVNVFNQERGDFEFKPGAIFANIVLGDEINRASPKTQSALLECMEERQVTVDTETHPLGHAVHGDRHAEPDRARGHVPAARGAARPVHAPAVDRVPDGRGGGRDPRQPQLGDAADRHRTGERRSGRRRDDRAWRSTSTSRRRSVATSSIWWRRRAATPDMYLGASPRASIMILRASRAMAAADERDYVIPDDVKALAVPSLAHRIIVTADAVMSGRSPQVILEEILAEVPVPVAENP